MTRLFGLALFAVTLAGFPPASRAAFIVYTTTLSGPNESPPNNSPGTGTGEVDIDVANHIMKVHVEFKNLLAGTTASHIHTPTPTPLSGTAGVATTTPTFPNFPLGVTSGTYDQTFNTLDRGT